MAQSKRETILQKIITTLSDGLGVPVYRSPTQALERTAENVNACVVEWDQENHEPLTSDEQLCLFSLSVSLRSRAVQYSEEVADELMVDAHALLFADRTLGGLTENILQDGASRNGEDKELETTVLTLGFLVEYRRSSADLTA